ncbi:MAG: hypothetical protein HW414_773 [Dehalococcoidia bacterium]|nr:hypothetical protein [Dehalococcoidia bacterium]
MAQQDKAKRANISGAPAGAMWFAGWLFTIAFTQPVWWKILLGLVIWPYYLGVAVR